MLFTKFAKRFIVFSKLRFQNTYFKNAIFENALF